MGSREESKNLELKLGERSNKIKPNQNIYETSRNTQEGLTCLLFESLKSQISNRRKNSNFRIQKLYFKCELYKNVAEVKSKACAPKYKYTNWRLYSHNPSTDRK